MISATADYATGECVKIVGGKMQENSQERH